jgi:anti-sigma regulatory factor (Ser/Thr protein kinase)
VTNVADRELEPKDRARAYDEVVLCLGPRAGSADVSTSHLELPARAGSAGTARQFARLVLSAWGSQVPGDDVELVVSELVTNAVTAAAAIRSATVVLALSALADGAVRIDVWDPAASGVLMVAQAGHDAEGGRGLLLVSTLAAAWGQAECAVGTQVWARLAGQSAAVAR